LITFIKQNVCLQLMVDADVSVFVVGSIPTGMALSAKLPLAWAY